MTTAIESAFAELDNVAGQLPLRVILDWLECVPLCAEDVANYLIFHPERYVRNRFHDGPSYQALLLCWRNGQRSPIHNHRGSACGVKVLRGIATETFFTRAPNGLIVPVSTRELTPNQICGSVEDDTHQVSNLQPGQADLVTLHIYSPPLVRMEVFSLDTPAIQVCDDPVNDPIPLGGGI
jgi:cysteine dioxygenase